MTSKRPVTQPVQAALLRVLLLVIASLSAHPGYSDTTSVNLDRDQSVLLGRELLAKNKPDIALALADALVARDPKDPEALVLKAAALQQHGRHDEARDAAREAFAASVTDYQKFESAMLVGRSYFQAGAYSKAQFWLRRAAQAAPDAQTRQTAERNFRYVRRVNPLAFQLSFGVKSASNINNGTSSNSINVFGLPFRIRESSRALSGTEFAFDLGLRYRLTQTERSETAVVGELESRTYRLSSESQRKAPDARASDYSFQRVELGAVHRFAPRQGRSVYEVGGGLGRIWYGGEKTIDYASLSLSQSFQLPPSTGIRFTFSTDRQIRHNSAARSASVYELEGQVTHELDNGAWVILLGSIKQTEASASFIENREIRADIIYRMPEPIFGVRLSPTFGLEQRRFPNDVFQQRNRRDLTTRLGVAASFENIEYLGFSPTVHVEFSETSSNIALYEIQSLDVFLRINSRF